MAFFSRYFSSLGQYKSLLALALPVALQTAIFSSKSTVDTLMLGTLSEFDIAAIGLAAKAQMIISFFIIGLSIGGGQIAAQCFGIKSEDGERKLHNTVFITLLLSVGVSFFFFVLLFFTPELLMALGTQSQEVIQKGSDYLHIIALSLFCFAYASSIACGLRAMHQPGIATKVSFIGVALNLGLNWVFIFGHLGMPAMGIKGAALGTLLSAVIECVILYFYLKSKNHLLASFPLTLYKQLNLKDFLLVTKLSSTAAVNSVVWAAGLFAFHAILGYSDPNLLVALSVLAPVEALAMSLLIGLATAGSVLVGNLVGANNHEQLPIAIRQHLIVSVFFGVMSAGLLLLIEPFVLSLFFHNDLPSAAEQITAGLYDIMAASLIVKSLSMMLIVGVLRAGGDASFCLITDVFAQWVFLLPCAYWLTHVLNFPPVYLFGLVLFEEAIKVLICCWRLNSGRWVKNLAESMN
ncbi:MATE family efflux transporter [Enterovibrio sp. ZSDZ35]|uniref:Multidrug resistance protein NorM n=1 Tax=Enterovibrio qingdaonensis TaxID=2899818 RepID=A0ABT5QJC9_9GAMM|nr:MATE family efflux transporter [Enterovibrio sp. ZSDZ35]MDD1781090.1 MATE family efflux transporter [Enterovibrio sp. ZSDZ35]